MKLLFVTSQAIGSSLIRWALKTDCSHFAICFDEDQEDCGIAFHSFGRGTQLVWLKDFKKKYKIIHELTPIPELASDQEEIIYKKILKTESNRKYDYFGLLYFALVALINRVTGKQELPKNNRWQRSTMRLCTGIAKTVFDCFEIKVPNDLDFEMVSPETLFKLAAKSGRFSW